MATQADVRRIALKLPGVEQATERFAFSVPNKGKSKEIAWVWMERVDAKKPRVANPSVVAIRVANLAQRNAMVAAEPKKFFTEPHYQGFPALLVRLAEVSAKDLEVLLAEAWRCMAPREQARGDASPTPIGRSTTVKRRAGGANKPASRTKP